MAVNTTSRWKLCALVSASVFALACGGDDDEGGGGGGGKNDGGTPPTNLGAGIVGKECTAATDCGGGQCKTTQGIGGLSDILGVIGLDTALVAPGGYCSLSCTADANCGEGGVCFGAVSLLGIQGECRKRCTSTADCRSGYECAQSQASADGGVIGGALSRLPAQCQALPSVPTLGPNQVGAACSDAADAGAALNMACGQGDCTFGSCTASCLTDSTCGAGAVCVPNGLYGSVGTCQESCNVDSDCNQFASGDVGCVDVDGRKLCGLKQFPLPANTLGKACAMDSECGNGSCVQTLGGATAAGGYCTLVNCQDDSVCTGGVCIGAGFGTTRCYDSCTVNSECRTGYTCQDRTTNSDVAAKVCAPAPGGDAGTTRALIVGGLDAGI